MKNFLNTLRGLLILAVLSLGVISISTHASNAATVDLRQGNTTDLPANALSREFVLRQKISFVDNPTTVSDVVQVFNIPAGTFVIGVGINCTTVEGATATIDVGDATTANGYLDDLTLNSLGQTFSSPGVLVTGTPNTYGKLYAQGKFYSSAGVLQILVNTASENASVFTVSLVCIKVF